MRKSINWSSNLYNKLYGSHVLSNLEEIIKDVEDSSITDSELAVKCLTYSDELKKKLRDVKIHQQDDCSLLHLAARFKRDQFCLFLIEELRIDKDIKNKIKQTPLHYLIAKTIITQKDCIEPLNEDILAFKSTLNIFLNSACDLNARDENSCSPLHLAINDNYLAAITLLNTSGIQIDIENKNKATPLHLACRKGDEDIALLLIDRLSVTKLVNFILNDFTNGALLPLHVACKNKNEKYLLVKTYLEKISFENQLSKCLHMEDESKQSILHISIENNHLNIVEMLFREYHMSNELRDSLNGNLPIHCCAMSGSIEMFSLLQKHDAVSFHTNNSLQNALHIAAFHGRSKFIREFLSYEQFCLGYTKNEVKNLAQFWKENTGEIFIPCVCSCDIGQDSYVPATKVKDQQHYTPLMTAIAASNLKCVEELSNHYLTEMDVTDLNGNSIYHICAQYDNLESLKYLLDLTNSQNDMNLFGLKNNFAETILHLASFNGNLEMINFILSKLYASNGHVDKILYARNRKGQTCFHVAANKGFFNLIEYFLKKKKLFQYLSHVDNDLNTGLHLAAINGFSSIACLMLESGADADLRNIENLSPLDLSCRMGHFEMSKNILEYSNLTYEICGSDGNYPLHLVCREGIHDLVQPMLSKGAKINHYNSQNQNCLDLAISRGQRDVIKVLLNDPNWFQLIKLDASQSFDYEEEEHDFKIIVHFPQADSVIGYKYDNKDTFSALYENKMWDIFHLILSKCKINENEMNFTIIDGPSQYITKHPLMLIACSGQENLIKHETTTQLLNLKWRYWPCFFFYFSLIYYLLYLVLFSWYTIQVASSVQYSHPANQQNNSTILKNSTNTFFNIFLSSQNTSNYDEDSNSNQMNFSSQVILYKVGGKAVGQEKFISTKDFSKENELKNLLNEPVIMEPTLARIVLIGIIVSQLVNEFFQIIFFERLFYFISFQNWLELSTYTISLGSLFATSYSAQSSYGSIAVLFAYMLLPLFIQKLDTLGIYVVALKRTLINSAKLLPIFLILFIGFLFSFRLRTQFGVSFSESDSLVFSLFRTLTMAIGELDTSKMGLYTHENNMPNYIIYFLFVLLMCMIVLNLFVGIAVGEIKTVLDEAEVQLICIRIAFSLKIQSAMEPFKKYYCLKNILNMNFRKYNRKNENKLIKLYDVAYKKTMNLMKKREEPINLSDPQKRIEDSLERLSKLTLEQVKAIKMVFTNQINEIETKLANSQCRLQDTLNEFAGITTFQMGEFNQETKSLNESLKKDLKLITSKLDETASNLNYTNRYFNSRLADTEQRFDSETFKLEGLLIDLAKKSLFQFESVKETCIAEPKSIRSLILSTQRLLEEFLIELIRSKMNDLNVQVFIENDQFKNLLNNMIDKTIEKLNIDNQLNSNSQGLHLELLTAINQIKEANRSEFNALKEKSSSLERNFQILYNQANELKSIVSREITK